MEMTRLRNNLGGTVKDITATGDGGFAQKLHLPLIHTDNTDWASGISYLVVGFICKIEAILPRRNSKSLVAKY
jgi:hypothetical protein